MQLVTDDIGDYSAEGNISNWGDIISNSDLSISNYLYNANINIESTRSTQPSIPLR